MLSAAAVPSAAATAAGALAAPATAANPTNLHLADAGALAAKSFGGQGRQPKLAFMGAKVPVAHGCGGWVGQHGGG